MSTRFTRQTDLKRSSGLRLSTPVRSLVERVAASAGLTYSDAIRLLVEEALAARAGAGKLPEEILRIVINFADEQARRTQALSTIEQTAIVRLELRIDTLQRQIEEVLDLLAEKEEAR